MEYTVGSLFAGVGGIDLGFQQAKHKDKKYKIIWANEIDEYASVTYRKNFSSHQLYTADIEKIVKPEREKDSVKRDKYKEIQYKILSKKTNVLTGGFPCQAFSIAGYRKGFDDHRGNLFWSIIDLIKLMDKNKGKPEVLFLENVKNLINHNKGNTYKVIKSELEKLGYSVIETILNAKNITNIPQNRERMYIVGFLDNQKLNQFNFFEKCKDSTKDWTKKENKEIIKTYLDKEINPIENEEFFYNEKKYPHYYLSKNDFIKTKTDRHERINLKETIKKENVFYQIRRGMYIRENKTGVCPTLTANMGTGGHNVPVIIIDGNIRKLTPKEVFLLQGFPVNSDYRLPNLSNGRLYKQAGNSVSVKVIKQIAQAILKVL